MIPLYNECSENEKGHKVQDFEELIVGRKYIYDFSNQFIENKIMQCGQLIRVKLDRSLNKLNKIEYNSLYFQVGMTIYTEEIGLEQCIQEFHTQSHIPMSNHYLQIFCYKMDNKIQNQLKNYHYIRAIASFCESLNISEDIQRKIISFM